MKTFTDDRGTIEDLKVGKDWSVTYISFKKGAVRGNHYHKETTQTDVILSGRFVHSNHSGDLIVKEGDVIVHTQYEPHAYMAIEDSEMVSICKGVRIGDNYEEDTFRLADEKKLL